MAPARWVIGNWKQNLLRSPARACARAIAQGVTGGSTRVGIAPTNLALDAVGDFVHPTGPLWLFAQDVAAQDVGAFTGEVGPAMLREARVQGGIVGHSERRAMFGDHDELVAAKLRTTLDAGLVAVLCVGEPSQARDRNEHESVVISQLYAAFQNISDEECDERLLVAYEPVWAIGTGKTATPAQAAAMHRTIRRFLAERFGERGADRSILYGGSVKPDNAGALMAAGDVDGFLVGGASLDPSAFLAIVRATEP